MKPGSAVRLSVLALLWGSSFLWIKLALHGLDPVQLAAARLAILAAEVRRLDDPRERVIIQQGDLVLLKYRPLELLGNIALNIINLSYTVTHNG